MKVFTPQATSLGKHNPVEAEGLPPRQGKTFIKPETEAEARDDSSEF
jgi:hypothetical protein